MGNPADDDVDWDALAPGSDYSTPEEEEAYDRWFRAKVEASLADPRPGVPHDEVMAEIDRIIAEKTAGAGRQTK